MSEPKLQTLNAELEQTRTMLRTIRQQLAAEEKENQQLRGELEKVKSDNEWHRKLNLEYETQLIECRGFREDRKEQ